MRKNLLFVFVLVAFFGLFNLTIYAHNGELSITYDNCMEDGNLKWYNLMNTTNDIQFHPSTTMKTIKYYIADNIPNIQYHWNTEFSNSEASEIKNSLCQSMKKWNDIYFYKYDSNNIIEKCEIVSVEEGTEHDFNLIIYPIKLEDYSFVAGTSIYSDNSYIIENIEGTQYKHTNKWQMFVDVKQFAAHDDYPITYINKNRSFVGAHEMGHILGLDDLRRENCGYNVTSHSHNETIMGYGTNNHVEDITYQDLAGVAITRGFHTDNDHRWLRDTSQMYDGKYKLICSICNGVKYVSSLTGYTYYNYGNCNNNHTLSSNNMIALGCNGDKDYIKCKYCRYVAPIEDMVTQNYTYQTYNSNYHKKINNVTGLNYTILEEHNTTSDNTNTYAYKDKTGHDIKCKCGYVIGTEYHAVTQEDCNDGNNRVTCVRCGIVLNMSDSIFIIGQMNITKYSINGSYILPNGIIILVYNDIQSYLNNTLIFYDKNNLPQIS